MVRASSAARSALASPTALSTAAVMMALAATVVAPVAAAAPSAGHGAAAPSPGRGATSSSTASVSSSSAPSLPASWPGEELPLPLAVRTPQDLAVKAAAERQYLLFNLLAGGKLAYDRGDFTTAAAKWEALLRLPGLDADLDRVVRPLAVEARGRAGGGSGGLASGGVGAGAGGGAAASSKMALPRPLAPGEPSSSPPAGSAPPAAAAAAASPRAAAAATVSGVVTGGGALGPGGTVLWLKRLGGETPRPAPARGKVISQRGKTFIPRVLAVPVGTKVDFRNEDDIFHNVFSLSRPNDFDTGLYRQGGSYVQTFRKVGVVQILCNIHSSMLGYVYVVDTPWYTQADGAGAFTIRNVPPGDYEIEAWHEASSRPWKQRVTVSGEGVRGLAVRIAGDRRAPAFVPDKSGKPRQSHLNY